MCSQPRASCPSNICAPSAVMNGQSFPRLVRFISATGTDGQPLANKKDWRVDTQKELPAYITCWVRMFREERARVIGARSVHAGVRPGHDEPRLLGKTWNLEW